MTLKDWKKYQNGWRRNKTPRKYLWISRKYLTSGDYYVSIASSYLSGWKTDGQLLGIFKTKSQALKYARAYMRKH